MSSTTNNPYLVKSMNSTITINDGMGTIIENGIVTANSIKTNNILAEYIDKACSMFNNIYNGVIITLGPYITISDNKIDSNSGALQVGTNSTLILGDGLGITPVRSWYSALTSFDVINLDYLQNSYTNFLLGSANTWYGTYNNFETQVYALNIAPKYPETNLTIGTVSTTSTIGKMTIVGNTLDTTDTAGIINMGITRTNNIGSLRIAGNEFDTAAFGVNLNIGISATNLINMGGQSPTVFGGTGTRILGNKIDLANAGTLTIGSSTTTSALTLSSNSTGITGGTSVITCDNGITATPYLNIVQTATQSRLDFHSAGTSFTDTRITASGGTSVNNNGSFNIASGAISLSASNTINLTSTNTTNITSQNGFTSIAGYNNAYLEVGAGGNNCFLDFHSYNGTAVNYDARIICNGSTGVAAGTGIIEITGRQTKLSASQTVILTGTNITSNGGPHTMNNGLAFGKGNLTSSFFIQTGQTANSTSAILGLNPSGTPFVITFPTAFSAQPIVTVSLVTGTNNSIVCGLVLSAYALSASGFTCAIYNTRTANTGTQAYACAWHAIGAY